MTNTTEHPTTHHRPLWPRLTALALLVLAGGLIIAGLVGALTAAGALSEEVPYDQLECPAGSTIDPFGAGQCVQDDPPYLVVGEFTTDGVYHPSSQADLDDQLGDDGTEVLSEEQYAPTTTTVYVPTPADLNDVPAEPVLVTPAFTG